MDWPHDLLRDLYNDPDMQRKYKRCIRSSLPAVEVDYKGCRMLLHPADNNTEFQIWRRGRTHEERPLRKILAKLKGKPFIAFDVGANAGSFTVRLGALSETGSVIHAFEPNPVMRDRLLKNLSLNNIEGTHVHSCAVSDQEGEMNLFIPDAANLGQARLEEAFSGGNKIKVKVRVITDFLPANPEVPIDFLKVDVEGFEDRTIIPLLSEKHRKQRPKLIFFEHKHSTYWKTDVPKALLDNGYRLSGEFGRNALFELVEK